MASAIVDESLRNNIKSSRILVVGAGGIGCELLKNLVLTGFNDIEVIDLDTIDVSNLNRQFLFRREHVGKPKSEVAKESALKFNPDANIKAYHDTVMSTDYDVHFFKQFNIVMNALDNRAARNHVNRLCLAANVPLIESGSAGYLGQVTVIKKGITECYECQPKPAQKTFPGCTIRNTPSEPIHCVVWGKHLFNQMFGEEDPDQDVSPDTEDPELAGDAGKTFMTHEAKDGMIDRKSTRLWAQEIGYDAKKLFNKLFCDDIKYLLSMENLWKKRRQPTPLDWNNLPKTADESTQSLMKDRRIGSVQEYADLFKESIAILKKELAGQGVGGMLVWDKDDEAAMDFVTCAANIRAHIFGISLKSRFDIKSMAGNIIPAIATTNAIIAALIVMESLKILQGRIKECKSIYLNRQPNPRKRLLVPCELVKANPKCYVCSEKPEVIVRLNTTAITVKTLEDRILKCHFGMVAPDVEIDDGKGTILISSEEGETDENAEKCLHDFHIKSDTRLKCDDFLQNLNLIVNILHIDKLDDDKEFEVIGDMSQLTAKPEEQPSTSNGASNKEKVADDEVLICTPTQSKRKRSVEDEDMPVLKKAKADTEVIMDDEDVILLD